MEPEERAQAGRLPGLPVSGRDPGRHQRLLPPRGLQRDPEGARRGGDRPDRLPRPAGGEAQGGRVGSRDHERAVNSGFSGGEKKRNEILQMAVLEPKLAILDETDSGLDIDALRIVAEGVNTLRRPDRVVHRGDPLPAAAQLHRARLRARALRRPDREVGRQGAGAGARGPGLRMAGRGQRRREPERERGRAAGPRAPGRSGHRRRARTGWSRSPGGRGAVRRGRVSRPRGTRSGASRRSRRIAQTHLAPRRRRDCRDRRRAARPRSSSGIRSGARSSS